MWMATLIFCVESCHTSTSVMMSFHHITAAIEKERWWVLEWDLGTSKRVIAHHHPHATLRPPPGCSQIPQVGHLLNLCLVKHSKRGNLLSVLQAVLHCWLSCCCNLICLPLLLLMLLLALVLLLLSRLLVSWQIGVADESFCPLLHLV